MESSGKDAHAKLGIKHPEWPKNSDAEPGGGTWTYEVDVDIAIMEDSTGTAL